MAKQSHNSPPLGVPSIPFMGPMETPWAAHSAYAHSRAHPHGGGRLVPPIPMDLRASPYGAMAHLPWGSHHPWNGDRMGPHGQAWARGWEAWARRPDHLTPLSGMTEPNFISTASENQIGRSVWALATMPAVPSQALPSLRIPPCVSAIAANA